MFCFKKLYLQNIKQEITMRLNTLFATAIVALSAAVSLSSCSKDAMSEKKMTGLWEVTEMTITSTDKDGNTSSNTDKNIGVRVEFIKGGALNLYSKDKESGDWAIEQADASWSCEGDKLVLTGINEEKTDDGLSSKTAFRLTVRDLTNKTMTLCCSRAFDTNDVNYGGISVEIDLEKVKK